MVIKTVFQNLTKKNKAEPFQNIKTMHGKIITTMRLDITFIDLLANPRSIFSVNIDNFTAR